MKTSNLLITGSKGGVGTQLIKTLVSHDISFRALVRNKDQGSLMRSLPQAEVVIGDLADIHRLTDAFHGIERAFLLTSSSEDAQRLQLNFVNAAHAAGVKHIVKLSQWAADEASPVRFLRYHAAVENHIKALGMDYTFLRPNLFMQGLTAFEHYIKHDGKFYGSLGQATVSAVDVRDIAAVAARALTEHGHEKKTYQLTGPASITHDEMADTLSSVLGRKITYVDLPPEQMKHALEAAGFPTWQVEGLVEDYAHYSRGEAAEVFSTVAEVTGKQATSFEQFALDYKACFS